MDDGEEAKLCSVHPHTGFMVDVIDASIPAIITVGDGGLFFNHTPEMSCFASHAAEMNQQKWETKEEGIQRIYGGSGTRMRHFTHFFQSVLTHRLIVLLGDWADGLLTSEFHQEEHLCVNLTDGSDGLRPSHLSVWFHSA